jgi:hypothetical protein
MNFRLKCENPGEIEYTITATMTADQWERVREALDKAQIYYGPTGELIKNINNLLAQARKIYWTEDATT